MENIVVKLTSVELAMLAIVKQKNKRFSDINKYIKEVIIEEYNRLS